MKPLAKTVSVVAKTLSVLAFLLALGAGPVPVLAETAGAAPPAAPVAATININTASAEEIAAALNGVGPKIAEAVVAYRTANGPFKDKAQLLEVKGIGDAILKKNEALIRLE